MEYNHSRKAGNLGDVWKHFILVELANAIIKRSDSFCYIESHSGAPIHELPARGEWVEGVGKVSDNTSCDFEYISVVREWLKTEQYPAGWVFMANELAKRFKKVEVGLFDTDDKVAATYPPLEEKRISNSIKVNFRQQNGFEFVDKISGADLIFLDPPFYPNAESDWRLLTNVCTSLNLSHSDFVVWYPFYDSTKPQELTDRTMSFAWEVHWPPYGSERSQDLKGCGMLVSRNLIPLMRNIETTLNGMAGCMKSKLITRQPA